MSVYMASRRHGNKALMRYKDGSQLLEAEENYALCVKIYSGLLHIVPCIGTHKFLAIVLLQWNVVVTIHH